MNDPDLICLGLFRAHSFYPWFWNHRLQKYERECSLFGCDFFDRVEDVVAVGETAFEAVKNEDDEVAASAGQAAPHDHDWSRWRSTENAIGLYGPPHGPPFLYARTCGDCGMTHYSDKLDKAPSP